MVQVLLIGLWCHQYYIIILYLHGSSSEQFVPLGLFTYFYANSLDCKEVQPESILKEISPEYSLEGLMLKLELQYFGHLMWRADSLGKTLTLEKMEDGRRRGQQMVIRLDGITDTMDMNLSRLQELVMDREA